MEPGLHVPVEGQVDEYPPDERGNPGRERHQDQDRHRLPGPHPAVEVAQRDGQQKARDARNQQHLDVGARLVVQQGPDVLHDDVGAPADRLEHPEQQIAVASEVVERHVFVLRGRRTRPGQRTGPPCPASGHSHPAKLSGSSPRSRTPRRNHATLRRRFGGPYASVTGVVQYVRRLGYRRAPGDR